MGAAARPASCPWTACSGRPSGLMMGRMRAAPSPPSPPPSPAQLLHPQACSRSVHGYSPPPVSNLPLPCGGLKGMHCQRGRTCSDCKKRFLALVVPAALLVCSRAWNFSHNRCMSEFFYNITGDSLMGKLPIMFACLAARLKPCQASSGHKSTVCMAVFGTWTYAWLCLVHGPDMVLRAEAPPDPDGLQELSA